MKYVVVFMSNAIFRALTRWDCLKLLCYVYLITLIEGGLPCVRN